MNITESDSLSFRCNICGHRCVAKGQTSTGKFNPARAADQHCAGDPLFMYSMELFGESLSIQDFPASPHITGIGMSDWDGYAIQLSGKLNYRNTYYHQEPKLDITRSDPSLEGAFDFIISSDVFEHVPPPISKAFENTRKLLKPDGVLIFSVPYSKDEKTVEHFLIFMITG
jgi:SAM-dependent methyltransferase